MKFISGKFVTLYALEWSYKTKSKVTSVKTKVYLDFLQDPDLVIKESYVVKAKTLLSLRGTILHVKETEVEIRKLILEAQSWK